MGRLGPSGSRPDCHGPELEEDKRYAQIARTCRIPEELGKSEDGLGDTPKPGCAFEPLAFAMSAVDVEDLYPEASRFSEG